MNSLNKFFLSLVLLILAAPTVEAAKGKKESDAAKLNRKRRNAKALPLPKKSTKKKTEAVSSIVGIDPRTIGENTIVEKGDIDEDGCSDAEFLNKVTEATEGIFAETKANDNNSADDGDDLGEKLRDEKEKSDNKFIEEKLEVSVDNIPFLNEFLEEIEEASKEVPKSATLEKINVEANESNIDADPEYTSDEEPVFHDIDDEHASYFENNLKSDNGPTQEEDSMSSVDDNGSDSEDYASDNREEAGSIQEVYTGVDAETNDNSSDTGSDSEYVDESIKNSVTFYHAVGKLDNDTFRSDLESDNGSENEFTEEGFVLVDASSDENEINNGSDVASNSSDEEEANSETGDNSDDEVTLDGKNHSKSSAILKASSIGVLSGIGFYKLSDSFRKFVDTSAAKTKKATKRIGNSIKKRTKLTKAGGVAVAALAGYFSYRQINKYYGKSK